MPFIDIKKKRMIFKEWDLNNKLQLGPYGNFEPLEKEKSILPQLVIVPLLMFDRELHRLGYGGGYYDKTIYYLRNYFKMKKKFFITIGLAYSIQVTKKLPIENHDMKLDYIITDKEILSRFY